MTLTDTAIKKARAREKAYNMSDGEGRFLRIAPSGGKLWRWKYRHDGNAFTGEQFGGLESLTLCHGVNARCQENGIWVMQPLAAPRPTPTRLQQQRP
jgi:hypothetical protein